MKMQTFSIDHHVYRAFEFEFNSPHACASREGMMNVRAGKKARQSPDQPGAANRSPANVFNQPIGSVGVRRDHHFPAGEFAVAER